VAPTTNKLLTVDEGLTGLAGMNSNGKDRDLVCVNHQRSSEGNERWLGGCE